MKYIFYGTPKESEIVLDILKSNNYIPSLIITAPDRPSGRGLNISESPVSIWAKENGVALLKPESLKNTEIEDKIKSVDADIAIVFAYGKIIPDNILKIPKHGTLNIHPSLLPLYRGSSPIENTILAGDKEAGVSIMLLDALMDHGPIILQEKTVVAENESAPELLKRLVSNGAHALSLCLPDYISGKLLPKEQDHSKATYTKKISKLDGEINLTDDPLTLYRKYLAFMDWPGIYFFDRESSDTRRINIKKATFQNGKCTILRVVPEGKKEVAYEDYLRSKNK
ncbi:MAG: hypothetical protein RL641_825 [Candidatus Parcubacteria bacterium]|jgi:methionyl-tRNA formyltransferase